MLFKYNNGDKMKDVVTGYTGIVIAQTAWLNGCIRYMLQSDKLQKDGQPDPGHVFDEAQLVMVKKAVVKITLAPTGGNRPWPGRDRDPR